MCGARPAGRDGPAAGRGPALCRGHRPRPSIRGSRLAGGRPGGQAEAVRLCSRIPSPEPRPRQSPRGGGSGARCAPSPACFLSRLCVTAVTARHMLGRGRTRQGRGMAGGAEAGQGKGSGKDQSLGAGEQGLDPPPAAAPGAQTGRRGGGGGLSPSVTTPHYYERMSAAGQAFDRRVVSHLSLQCHPPRTPCLPSTPCPSPHSLSKL